MNKYLNILNTNLSLTNKSVLLSKISDKINTGETLKVIACDFRDLLYFQKMNNINLNSKILFYPDSSGVFLLIKLFFSNQTKNFKKLVSTDLHYELISLCIKKNYKVFLYGDTDETLKKFEKKVSKANNEVIVGKLNGFSQFSNDEIVKQINNSDADILLVGLGIPRQFEFLYKNQNSLKIPVSITVGAFFTFYSDTIKRAPKLLRILNLEWLFRFIKEPKRLFNRYFIAYPVFVLKIVKERFGIL